MKTVWVALALVVALGCGDDGPAGLKPERFTGDWVLNVEGNPSCFGASAGGPRYFEVDASGSGEAANGDRTFNVVTEFDFVKPFRGFGFMVIGNYNLTARTVELNFWHTVMQTGAQFTGTIDDDGSITGTLRDPRPGFDPHLVVGSCVFQATGHRLP
jgi:hypothetical protein